MSVKQLRLFAYSKPLSERFGAAFFRGLPKTPGVYLMFDGRGRVVYVGQSENLRARVSSYRHIHPDRDSRKLIRLVHSVDRIEWEQCETAEAAKLRENSLLREHRPRFNAMNTWPKAHCFIRMRCTPERWEFSYTRQAPVDATDFYGAYKSGCLLGYTSLLRLLWASLHQTTAPQDYPRALLGEKPPEEFLFEFSPLLKTNAGAWVGLLREFFDGYSLDLAVFLKAQLPPAESTSLFQQNFVAQDFAQLEDFFNRGPLRNLQLSRKNALTEKLIGQETLDDLLVTK